MQIILKAENISCNMKGKRILSEISFELHRGKRMGISGESGCGKTTLAKILAGLIIPDSGSIALNSNKSGSSKPQLLVLFQNNGELIHPLRRTGNILSEAVRKRGIKGKNQIDSEVRSICSLLNISEELLDRKGGQLSGGEQQRVGLARLLACQPEVLIVDEPFSSQDPESSENIITVLNYFNEKTGLTLISISHDLRSLSRVSDQILILNEGTVAEINSTAVIMKNPVHPYTRFLLKAANYDLKAEDFEK